ncbi:MAG: ATP-binding protein [Bacteroidales bacterium]|nr:ATP-binding protein [Bacteroidales bacterium]
MDYLGKKVSVGLELVSQGTAWFDDVRLVKDIDLQTSIDIKNDKLLVSLSTPHDSAKIYYSTNGARPDNLSKLYTGNFSLDSSCHLKAVVYRGNTESGWLTRQLTVHKGIGAGISYQQAYSEKYPGGGDIGLTNGQMASLNYLDPAKSRYRYILDDYDKDTTWSGTRNYAEYRNLPPGRYTFRVSGTNSDGIWNSKGEALEIRIHPPLYGSAGAKIAYLLIFISALAAYVKWRTRHLEIDRERLEALVRQKTLLVEDKNRQLEETDRMKTAFFTDVAHEIRTPLSLILAPIETIAGETQGNERIRGLIELISRNGQRLMTLVEQLLDISRLNSGKMKLTLIEGDVIKCIRILVYEFLSLAERKNINYIVDIPDIEFFTFFDRDKLEKILSNLLSNAFKFTPGGGTVNCRVTLSEAPGESWKHELILSVRDTGIGIPPKYHDRIFDRFFRVGAKNGYEYQGTGIGLSLIKDYANLMHGTIRLDSEADKGAEFTLRLPMGSEHLAPEEYIIVNQSRSGDVRTEMESFSESGTICGPEPDTHSRMRILLIEDNSDLRGYIAASLPEYEVLMAGDGKTGVNMAFTRLPEIVITDIMLPGMDGISICRQLKNDMRTSHIPVLMLTARTTAEDKLDGLMSGADAYISKPFSLKELRYQLSNHIKLQQNLRLKYSNLKFLGSDPGIEKSADDIFMEKVVGLMNANLRDFSFGVSAMKESMGMSRTHLYRKIKALTGQTPVMLIRNLRLERAAELLRSKTGNVTEIAYSVGFSNPSYFAKAFREYFGVTPRAFASGK